MGEEEDFSGNGAQFAHVLFLSRTKTIARPTRG